jgi:hypothetical protein
MPIAAKRKRTVVKNLKRAIDVVNALDVSSVN